MAELRTLEKKMGLVLTLVSPFLHDDDNEHNGIVGRSVLIAKRKQFKASVWGVMQDQEAAQEEAMQAELAKQQQERSRGHDQSQRDERWDESY